MDVVAADRAVLNAGVERAAQEVRDRLAPGPGLRLGAGYALQDHANLVLDGLLGKAARNNAILARSDQARDTRVALTGLRRVLHLLRVLQHAVHPLHPSEDGLGLGSLYFTAEMARGLIRRELDLIESPSEAPRFATLSWPYSKLLNGRPTEQATMPVLLHYPGQEANAALLVPLLIHELGHPAAESHGLVDMVHERLELDPAWPETVAALRESLSDSAEPASLNVVRATLAGPIEEVVCDALATACLGPSYLLAFAAWAGLDSAGEWREQHPPTALRLGIIVDQLRKDDWDLNWLAGVVAWAERLDQLFEHGGESERARTTAMTLAAPHVRTVVNTRLGREFPRLVPADYRAQVERGLEDLFEQDILPAQLDHKGTPADRRCILLAGWKAALKQHGDSVGALVAAFHGEDARAHNSYLDKALEMSTLLERWGAP